MVAKGHKKLAVGHMRPVGCVFDMPAINKLSTVVQWEKSEKYRTPTKHVTIMLYRYLVIRARTMMVSSRDTTYDAVRNYGCNLI
jgi:hypothetical protein